MGHYQKRIGTRLRNLKNKEKGLRGRGGLTDATTDHLLNFGGVAIRQNKENLEKMKSSLSTSLFHVASNKDNDFHFAHCPAGPDSWCKFNAGKVNKTNTYKPGPGLPNDVIQNWTNILN